MKILITGITGFIGRHLAQVLRNGEHCLYGISRSTAKIDGVKMHLGDIADVELMKGFIKEINPDVAIHLAWSGIPDYSEAASLGNYRNSVNFLRVVADESDCRKIVCAGSCAEYGRNAGICDEAMPLRLNNFFSLAKAGIHDYLKVKTIDKNLIVNWARIFYVFGCGQRDGALIPSLIGSLKNGREPEVKNFSNFHDFIYILDVAEYLKRLAEHDHPSGAYNIGTGKAISVSEVASSVYEVFAEKTKSFPIDTTKTEMNFFASACKTQASTGFKPAFDLKKALYDYKARCII